MPRFYHKTQLSEHYWVFMGINLLEVSNPIRHVSIIVWPQGTVSWITAMYIWLSFIVKWQNERLKVWINAD